MHAISEPHYMYILLFFRPTADLREVKNVLLQLIENRLQLAAKDVILKIGSTTKQQRRDDDTLPSAHLMIRLRLDEEIKAVPPSHAPPVRHRNRPQTFRL
jgi:hypothetical protein